MVVPILNPMPTVVGTMNGIMTRVMGAKDSIAKKMKSVKTFVNKNKRLAQGASIVGFIGMLVSIFKKPLEFILMVIGGIIMCIIYVLYKITVYPPLNWIIFIVWFFFTKVVFLIFYTIVIGVVIVCICFFLLIITILNLLPIPKKGWLNNIVLCQNSPDSWYKVPNYHLGNKFERSLFCKSACATGHAPDELTGEFCDRIPKGQPSYCPQAEIMRIITDHSRGDRKYLYDNYDTTTNVWYALMTPADKETAYKHYYFTRKKFFNKCEDTMGTYNKMTLDFCSSLDMMKKMKYNGLSDSDIARLEKVCHQNFCDSRNRYSFCGKFGKNEQEEKSLSELIKQIVIFMLTAIIFMYLLYLTYQYALSI